MTVAPKTHLAVVAPGARVPTKAEPKNITEALRGSGRDVMAAMRTALAKKLDDGEVSSNAIASAYKELRELDRLIRIADADAAEEAQRNGNGADRRRSFDATAI